MWDVLCRQPLLHAPWAARHAWTLALLSPGAPADPVLDTKGLLAWSQSTAVLSFRGTASLKNACR